MPVYRTNRHAESYGQSIGILLLDARMPFPPGDVANASTYRYPVVYKIVPGLATDVCLNGAPEFAGAIADGARELARQGVRGISSDCGFMLQYQRAAADAVDVPVAMSSLLQLPLIERSVGPGRPIGVLTADSANLSEDFLERAGIKPRNPIIIRGMQDEPEFYSSILDPKGTMDTDLINEETVAKARAIKEEHPDLGAILLECSLMPPYAAAVQEAVGVPVFDFVSLIDFMQAGTNPRRYQGFM